MPDNNQTFVQPVAQSQAPSAPGNPGTVYNVAPQGDAFGNWYAPQGNSGAIIQQLLNQSYGRRPVVVPPISAGGPVTTPPVDVSQPAPVVGLHQGHGGGSTGAGSGGGGVDGGRCVGATMFLAPYIRASTIGKGFSAQCYSPEEGFKSHVVEQVSAPVLQPCWRIVTQFGAALVCSGSTPFDLPDGGTALAPDMLGKDVFVKRGYYVVTERVVSCEFDGERAVVPLGFGGRSFPAGEEATAMIFSHNIMKAVDGSANIARMEGLRSGFENARTIYGDLSSGIGVLAPNSNPAGPQSAGQTWAAYEAARASGVNPTTGVPAPTPTNDNGWTTVTDANGHVQLIPPAGNLTNIPLPPIQGLPHQQGAFGNFMSNLGHMVWDGTKYVLQNAPIIGGFSANQIGQIGHEIGGLFKQKENP